MQVTFNYTESGRSQDETKQFNRLRPAAKRLRGGAWRTSCSADNPELSRRSFLRASGCGAAGVLSNHVLGRARLTARTGGLLSPAPRPGWGVYRPEAPGDMASVDALAKRVGSGPRLLLWYEAWRSPWATPSQLVRQCRLVASAGCTPMLTWMTVDQTPSPTSAGLANAEVARGSQDAYVMACAQAFAQLRAPSTYASIPR